MAHRVDIVPVTSAHIRELGVCMRDSDAAEVWAMSRQLPVEAVQKSVGCSRDAWALTANGETLAVFGLATADLLSGVGVPWALTGEALDRYPIAAVDASRRILAYFLELYPILVNVIHERNGRALRWARRVGFKVAQEPAPIGHSAELFYPIVMIRKEAD